MNQWLFEHGAVTPRSVTEGRPPMIALLVTLTAKSGFGDQLYEGLLCAVSLVRVNEPGVVAYHVARSRDNPDIFKMYEVYRDQDAFDHHMSGTRYIEKLSPYILEPLVTAPEVEYLDSIME